MANTARMTSYQRREQLITVGRSLFATKGFEAVSVEEIAAAAKVSKPIVYEHFGGKEGLYAVVVDREMRALTDALSSALADPDAHPRQIVERTALALLTYIEENAEGFHVLVRDSPTTDPAGSFNSLLGDVSLRVEEILTESFKQEHFPARGVPYYAQMLVGLTVFTGQYWADRRKVSKEQLAAHIVNLAWYGLSRLQPKPELRFEGERAKKAEQKRQAKEAREHQAQAAREKTEERERRQHDARQGRDRSSARDGTAPDADNASAGSRPTDHGALTGNATSGAAGSLEAPDSAKTAATSTDCAGTESTVAESTATRSTATGSTATDSTGAGSVAADRTAADRTATDDTATGSTDPTS